MLKYNFKIAKDTNLVSEIICDSLHMSPDLTFISGITSSNYNLNDGQTIFIREGDSEEYKPNKIQVFDCIQRGYVDFMQKYNIIEYDYNGDKVYGIVFADNNKYIADSDGKLTINSINAIDGENVVNGISSTGIVTIKTRYYSYNSIIEIGGYNYKVDYNDEEPSIIVNGHSEPLILKDYDKIKKTTKFIIRKNLDYNVNVEHISYTKEFKYIISEATSNHDTVKKLYLIQETIDENSFKYYLLDNSNGTSTVLDNEYNPNVSINTIKFNDIIYEIFSEWKNTSYGNYIHLYLDDSEYYFKEGDIIKATNSSIGSKPIYSETIDNKVCFSVNGNYYFASDDVIKFMVYDNNEYQIFNKSYKVKEDDSEINNIQYYIIYNNTPLLITLNDNKASRVIESDEMENSFDTNTYDVISRKYVIINDIVYTIYNNSLSDEENSLYILYDFSNPILLLVENVTSSNQLRCSVLDNYNSDTNLISTLVNSHNNYIFVLENPLFDRGYVNNKPTNLTPYKNSEYRIYQSISNITIPIRLSNFNGTNLHQEYVCNTEFFGKEKEKVINRIIDMEKDLYYPAYYDYSENKFFNVDTIRFDLHFRSRNLSDWKINNDGYKMIDDNDETDFTNSDITYSNWNILDYYNWGGDMDSFKPSIDKTVDDYRYYQPSDLLYFLNFSDNDVFYQKNKIGKSFIRLSYYDTPDPKTQSLLYTSTIFMNEGNLYKKYISNKVDNGLFISVDKIDKKINRLVGKNIGVNYEPIDNDSASNIDYSQIILTIPQDDEISSYKLTFDEEKRLSSSFVIKNMYECSESSEGFYLYLFREYSTGIHERDIYLKVEFNHAGIGRTITFMQPHKLDGDNKEMLDLYNEDDMKILKNGCSLNKLYDNIFIKMHVKYDFDNKKFYYYLPEWLEEHNNNTSEMRFNLYELKIADES